MIARRDRAPCAAALLLAAACAAPPPVEDAGRDFDEAATFLLPGMESYRFERAPEEGVARFVECGRSFREAGIGTGDLEGVMVLEYEKGLPVDRWFEGPVIARIGETDVREIAVELGADGETSMKCWAADVDGRFRIVASRRELLDASLARAGGGEELVAALRPPVAPTWLTPVTIVRRYARSAPLDFTNPWSPRCAAAADRAAAEANVAIDCIVAEGSSADGTFELAVATATPDAAAAFLRAFFAPASLVTLETEGGAGVHRWRLVGAHDLTATFLFGHNLRL